MEHILQQQAGLVFSTMSSSCDWSCLLKGQGRGAADAGPRGGGDATASTVVVIVVAVE